MLGMLKWHGPPLSACDVWVDPEPDVDSGLLFNFPHYCQIGDSIYFLYTATARLVRTWRNDRRQKGNKSITFSERSDSSQDLD